VSSGFLTRLVLELIDEDNDLYKLLEPLIYNSELLGYTVVVPSGFVTDFASVPRLPFAYTLFGGMAKRAAVVHDFLYSEAGKLPRSKADAVFKEAMLVTGVSIWRRNFMWLGVRVFGGKFFK